MRWLIVAALAGCSVAPLPAESPHASVADTLPAPLVVDGEHIAWDVWWQGAQIGSATIDTTAEGSRAHFATSGLASLVGTLRFEQATVARSTTEDLVAGKTREHRVIALDTVRVPGGTQLHTLASTLGAMRAWATVGAPHAYAWVVVDGELYRVDVATPVPEALSEILSESGQTDFEKRAVVARSSTPVGESRDGAARSSTPVGESRGRALRVDGSVRPLDPDGDTVDFSVWLAADASRTPLRFAVLARGERITAQWRESTAITSN
ncbi:MAG TPA: hypothetical protein VGM90_26830 [Kofleriaceae bacterium]|jgi:hypothetical protein